ncbi:MAG TPA: cytochrome c maturation protein CcmE [Candidatus Polarisedimenticolia bacterium]|nr:cytochrome c maturation protein CcmE [Candidatus Polarisedimenticolia bacterium]
MARKRLQLIIGGIIILGGIGGLIVYSFNQSMVYDHSVAEFLGDPVLRTSHCRIYGKVKADSILRSPDGIGVSFAVTDGSRWVPVVYGREVPDTFKENGDVVVEGRLDGKGVFQARNLLAKCPSKYEGEGTEHPAEAEGGPPAGAGDSASGS